jgi:glycosyltransferase involved in cell wall biosynthesis
MDQPRKNLRVIMTVLGRKGGMDRIADLITETIEARPDLGVHVTRLTTRGSGGIFSGLLVFLPALARFWLAGLRGRADVLHLHVAAGGSAYRKLLLARVARHLDIPYVVHLHGSRFHEFWPSIGPRARQAVDRLFRESARIVVLGRFWAQLITDRVPGVKGRITVFPNATRPISGSHEPSTDIRVRISCLGELGPRKGTPQLLEALARLAARDDWAATIAGNGDVTGSREQAQRLGVADRIDIPGWLDAADVDSVLRRTDILVLPSFAENLPMAILEGFAFGLAVVATPVGAIPEVIDHERNGLIVPTGDVDALAAALRRLIEDPDLRRTLGAAARRDHADRYDINVYVPRLAAIWREAAQACNDDRTERVPRAAGGNG